jgi:pimeloyl-ACP methyl ester carboxylesterase
VSTLPEQLTEWRAPGATFSHHDHEIFWRRGGRGGAGETLLLIHGFPTSSFDWQPLWARLCERFALVVAADMIGFGWSDKPARYDYRIADQADLQESLLRSLGVTHCHVLAHDYGVTVTQELLARANVGRGLSIDSVCLLNGGLFPETHRALPMQRLLASPLGPFLAPLANRRSFGRSFAAIFGPHSQPTREQLDAFWSIISHADGQLRFPKLLGYMKERRQHRARWVGALRDTKVPIRVVNGSFDPISGAHMVARYRQLVPYPDCVALPDIGHYPQVEAPDAVWDAYADFFDTRVHKAR